MNVQRPGFVSSWKMLTREKGWIKPVLVLTLLGWIPLLGQIVVLGYSLEWARRTAWGMDAGPKRTGVRYGKVLGTGATALLVMVSLALALSMVFMLVEASAIVNAILMFATMGVDSVILLGTGVALYGSLAMWALGLLVSTFLSVAALRATIYDRFTAGWRLDRIFQMMGRDFGGFIRAYLVAMVAGLVQQAVYMVISFIEGLLALEGAAQVVRLVSTADSSADVANEVLSLVSAVGATPVLVTLLILLVLSFVGAIVSMAMRLVTINAVGQWFTRFDVPCWGKSADPLPEE